MSAWGRESAPTSVSRASARNAADRAYASMPKKQVQGGPGVEHLPLQAREEQVQGMRGIANLVIPKVGKVPTGVSVSRAGCRVGRNCPLVPHQGTPQESVNTALSVGVPAAVALRLGACRVLRSPGVC